MKLLENIVDDIVYANGSRHKIMNILFDTVRERVSIMHERAQAAEGRAAKAEKRLARLSRLVGAFNEGEL